MRGPANPYKDSECTLRTGTIRQWPHASILCLALTLLLLFSAATATSALAASRTLSLGGQGDALQFFHIHACQSDRRFQVFLVPFGIRSAALVFRLFRQ